MNAKLRLHPAPTEPPATEGVGGPFKFPARAMSAIKRRSAAQARPARPLSFNGNADLVRQVEQTLDRMQQRLDHVKGQLDNFRFPIERLRESDRPRAA